MYCKSYLSLYVIRVIACCAVLMLHIPIQTINPGITLCNLDWMYNVLLALLKKLNSQGRINLLCMISMVYSMSC